ncbi:MAG TPA: hypothetical protein VFH15_15480 [Pyrinomonadaceae bacterium]|nr:hypothetical protein [Pyrinomonadaceae bacterium]
MSSQSTPLLDLPVADDGSSPATIRTQAKIPHEEIDRLLEEIENPEVREMMSVAFSALLSLLQDVPALASPNHGPTPDEPKEVMERFRREATSLIDFIGTVATSTEGLDQSLAETMDGIAFALEHDLKRTFDSELKGLGWKPDDVARGKIAYVRGLLTNCLQQSVITLAQVFDPGLDGAKLFDNYKARLRESLLLCRDLTDMVLFAHACEKDITENFSKLVTRVNTFRSESMQFLMYKDWREFETISENLLRRVPDSAGVGSPLHSFTCYLETLLGQVKLRAVLVDVFCHFFPDGEATDAEWSEAQNRLAFELYRAELTSTVERNAM